MAKSTLYQTRLDMMKPVINRLNGKAIKLLSIGAGTGHMEDDQIRNCELQISYYHAIEPNESLLVDLRKTISNWNIDFKVEQNYFSDGIEIDSTFDMILMSHCLYGMNEPLKAIIQAKSFLKPEGKLIIFHQSDKGGYELHTHFTQNATFDRPPLNDGTLSSKHVCDMLKSSGVNYSVTEGNGTLEVDDFVRKRDTPIANDVITLFLQTRFENLDDERKSEIFGMTKERCVKDPNGMYLFRHPVSMIQIVNTN